LFVDPEYLANHPLLKAEAENTAGLPLSLVHPKNYLRLHERCSRLETSLSIALDLSNRPLKEVLSVVPPLTKRALRKRIRQGLDLAAEWKKSIL
jgi:hypothetical protein